MGYSTDPEYMRVKTASGRMDGKKYAKTIYINTEQNMVLGRLKTIDTELDQMERAMVIMKEKRSKCAKLLEDIEEIQENLPSVEDVEMYFRDERISHIPSPLPSYTIPRKTSTTSVPAVHTSSTTIVGSPAVHTSSTTTVRASSTTTSGTVSSPLHPKKRYLKSTTEEEVVIKVTPTTSGTPVVEISSEESTEAKEHQPEQIMNVDTGLLEQIEREELREMESADIVDLGSQLGLDVTEQKFIPPPTQPQPLIYSREQVQQQQLQQLQSFLQQQQQQPQEQSQQPGRVYQFSVPINPQVEAIPYAGITIPQDRVEKAAQESIEILNPPIKHQILGFRGEPIPEDKHEVGRMYCDKCPASFVRKNEFRNHKDNCGYRVFTHKCMVCGNLYTAIGPCRGHVAKKHTGAFPYECEICHQKFQKQPEHSRHMNSAHPAQYKKKRKSPE